MNETRRRRLREAIRYLNNAASIVDGVCDLEQDCVDNTPENLQSSERFERMEDAVDNLSDALEKLEEAKDHIQSAISR